jgi:hypothetical protein
MGIPVDETELAIGLLLEARAFVAQHTGAEGWRVGRPILAASDALVRAWQAHPHQDAAARVGFAIARRALEESAGAAPYERIERDTLLGQLDAAARQLRDL